VLYLIIVLVVAVAGITRLYLMHRRERSQLNTIDGFRESLDRIGWHTTPRRVAARPDIRARAIARANPPRATTERVVTRGHRASRPSQGRRTASTRLDPARREAAKRRLEARRRGSLRIPG
jgi:hypothetical protein